MACVDTWDLVASALSPEMCGVCAGKDLPRCVDMDIGTASPVTESDAVLWVLGNDCGSLTGGVRTAARMAASVSVRPHSESTRLSRASAAGRADTKAVNVGVIVEDILVIISDVSAGVSGRGCSQIGDMSSVSLWESVSGMAFSLSLVVVCGDASGCVGRRKTPTGVRTADSIEESSVCGMWVRVGLWWCAPNGIPMKEMDVRP